MNLVSGVLPDGDQYAVVEVSLVEVEFKQDVHALVLNTLEVVFLFGLPEEGSSLLKVLTSKLVEDEVYLHIAFLLIGKVFVWFLTIV